MSDEERAALTKKLSDDLEDFVAERSLAARKRKEKELPDTRSIEEIVEVRRVSNIVSKTCLKCK